MVVTRISLSSTVCPYHNYNCQTYSPKFRRYFILDTNLTRLVPHVGQDILTHPEFIPAFDPCFLSDFSMYLVSCLICPVLFVFSIWPVLWSSNLDMDFGE
jgi:hypothetical protein